MLDRTSRSELLSADQIDFLIKVVDKKQFSALLRFIYFSQEADIIEAMDLFSSLTVVPRMKAIHYLLDLKSRSNSKAEYEFA